MTKLEIAKSATTFIVGTGASKIIASIIKNNTSPENLTDKVTMTAGTIVLGMMVADITRKYTDAQIDAAADWWAKNVKKS